MAKLREAFRHQQPVESVDGIWRVLFFNAIAAVLPFTTSLPISAVLALVVLAGISVAFRTLRWRLYTGIGLALALLWGLLLKPFLPGGFLGPAFYGFFFGTLVMFKTMNLRKYGDGILLLVLILTANATVLLVEQDSSAWLLAWTFGITILTLANLFRLNVKDFSSLSLLASLRSIALGTLYAFPLLAVLFYTFQRFSHMELYAHGGSGLTGLSATLEPGEIQNLTKNSAIAFRAVVADADLPKADLYWKGPVLSLSEGMKWTQGKGAELDAGASEADAPNECVIQQRIFLQSPALSYYHLGLDKPIPSTFQFLGDAAYSIRSRGCLDSLRLGYEAAPEAKYLKVSGEVSKRVEDLAEELGKSAENSRDFFLRYSHYVTSHGFRYSLTPPALAPKRALDDFLFEKKVGFCEHFAGSFAALARLAGIPSRVVSGFQGGKYNRFGGYWLVADEDAHAWAELWDPRRGWERFDPTLAVAPERIEKGAGFGERGFLRWKDFEDSQPGQAIDAALFWIRGKLEQQDIWLWVERMRLSPFLWGWPAGLLILWLLWRRARRAPSSALEAEIKKLFLLLDRKGLPKRRSEGLGAFRERLGPWMEGMPSMAKVIPAANAVFEKLIQFRYGAENFDRHQARVFLADLKRLQFRLRWSRFLRR